MRPLSSRETELKYLISLHRLEHMEQKAFDRVDGVFWQRRNCLEKVSRMGKDFCLYPHGVWKQ